MACQSGLTVLLSVVRSRGAGVVLLTLSVLAANQTSFGQRPTGATSGKPGGEVAASAPKEKADKTASPAGGNDTNPLNALPLGGGARTMGGNGRFAGGGHNTFSGFGGGFQSAPRLNFNIDSRTPTTRLLPQTPVVKPPQPSWLLSDLSQTPQVFFQKPMDVKLLAPPAATGAGGKSPAAFGGGFQGNGQGPMTADEKRAAAAEHEKQQAQRRAQRQAAESEIAYTLAKINHLNKKERDYFVKLLQEHRPDLAGLPFAMGDACRMSKGVSRQFISEIAQVKPTIFLGSNSFGGGNFSGGGSGFVGAQPAVDPKAAPKHAPSADDIARAKIAAWMQIFDPAPAAQRKEIVKKLAALDHAESTRALARMAVFSFEKDVRDAALSALTKRSGDAATPILLHGLRYPWPAIVQHAADAIVYLHRLDLVPELIDVLDEPDARAPFVPEGGCLPVVREVVRLNHHHNCITCHAPATSDPEFAKSGVSSDFLVAPVSIPVPDPQLPQLTLGGYNGFSGPSLSPDLFLRVDVTYLRQDFSLMQQAESVEFGGPLQRFDYLVRTREVKPKEMHDYARWAKQQRRDFLPPNQRAAQIALQQLTGRNHIEPTAAAWRKAFGL